MRYLLKQLFEAESSTYTYFLIDKETNDAIIIDPVMETLERDLDLIKELSLNVKYVLDTHIHADHITSAGKIREVFGAKTVIGAGSNVDCADILVNDGDILYLGSLEIKVVSTPGHTNSCTSYYVPKLNYIFTGDALLIRGNGRTDFQEGSSETLYNSVQKIFKLPLDTIIYPAHDYKGRTASTIDEEMKFNPRIANKTKDEFIQIMSELKLSKPKKIEKALPANLKCGKIID